MYKKEYSKYTIILHFIGHNPNRLRRCSRMICISIKTCAASKSCTCWCLVEHIFLVNSHDSWCSHLCFDRQFRCLYTLPHCSHWYCWFNRSPDDFWASLKVCVRPRLRGEIDPELLGSGSFKMMLLLASLSNWDDDCSFKSWLDRRLRSSCSWLLNWLLGKSCWPSELIGG